MRGVADLDNEGTIRARLRGAIHQLASSQAALEIGILVQETDADDARLWYRIKQVKLSVSEQDPEFEQVAFAVIRHIGLGTMPFGSSRERPIAFAELLTATASNCNLLSLLVALALYAIYNREVYVRYDEHDGHVWVADGACPVRHFDDGVCSHHRHNLVRIYEDSWSFLVASA